MPLEIESGFIGYGVAAILSVAIFLAVIGIKAIKKSPIGNVDVLIKKIQWGVFLLIAFVLSMVTIIFS